jgi:hypothetical protein
VIVGSVWDWLGVGEDELKYTYALTRPGTKTAGALQTKKRMRPGFFQQLQSINNESNAPDVTSGDDGAIDLTMPGGKVVT